MSIVAILTELRSLGGSLSPALDNTALVVNAGRGIPPRLLADIEAHRIELERLLLPPPCLPAADVEKFVAETGIADGDADLLRQAASILGVSRITIIEPLATPKPKARRGGYFATARATEWCDHGRDVCIPAGAIGILIRLVSEIADRFVRIGIEGDIASAEKRGTPVVPVWLCGRARTLAPADIVLDIEAPADAPRGRPWAITTEGA